MNNQADVYAKVLWDYMVLKQSLEKADAIIVGGSLDTRPAVRGAELFLQGWAPVLVMSGGHGRITKNRWQKSEAQTYAEIAQELGVPSDKILIEDKSTNSGENIRFTKLLLETNGIEPKKLILVHKPYAERRFYATMQKQWPEVDFIVTSPQVTFEEWRPGDGHDDFLHFLVGDMQRILIYPKKGYQIEQEVPDDVLIAFNKLIDMGYTEQLAKE